MAVVDYWNNSLSANTGILVGYYVETEEFSHDVYSFLLSTIRNPDQDNIGLLYRFTRSIQEYWEVQYSSINSISNLLSPENCQSTYLDYLRKNVGILDDLMYIWSTLSETEQRKFIKYFVRFCMYRGSDYGIKDILDIMLNYPTYVINDYFYYRNLESGDLSYETESALGRYEEKGEDLWLISEDDVSSTRYADSITVTNNRYKFIINTIVDNIVNPPLPNRIFITRPPHNVMEVGYITYDGSDYFVLLDEEVYFSQSEQALSTNVYDFVLSFESDSYVNEILFMQTSTINRDMVKSLFRFSRPLSERFYIRYYKLLEDFTTDDRWSVESGSVSHSSTNKTVTLYSDADESIYELTDSLLDVSNWSDYSLTIKSKQVTESKEVEYRFMYRDSDNYHYFKYEIHPTPTYPPASWSFGRLQSGVDVVIGSGTMEYCDLNVDYVWRFTSFTSNRSGTDYQVTNLYQDENLLGSYENLVAPWSESKGTIQLVTEIDSTNIVSLVRVNPFPMEYDFIGI